MEYLWTILLVGLIILEASTAQFVCIWFAGGALAALICALITDTVWIQFVVFIITTAVLLFSTRKIVQKLKNTPVERTNADSLLGQKAIVIEEISNDLEKGVVKLRGIEWSARSCDGTLIPKDAIVTVQRIDGVKLIVNIKED